MSQYYYLILDGDSTVSGLASSNIAQADGISTDVDTYEAAASSLGAVKCQDGKLIPIAQSPKVPDRLPRIAFRLQLLADGLLDDVEAWVANQDRGTQIIYADSDSFPRNDPNLLEALAAIGYTIAQVESFFAKAGKR
ncbi:hypothetical protein [Brucella pituitosa]|uniref:hypothetical protein n=1 Tax=Brucella pituitosa TaxID=571256 RepID=UPI001FFCB168|nr:hypothetical protein [Brucella pituitosa]